MTNNHVITLSAGEWRYKIAKVLDEARETCQAIAYTTHGRPKFLLIPMHKSLYSNPLRQSLLIQLRRLWNELVPHYQANLSSKNEPAIGADKFRTETGATLRAMTMQPHWYKRRHDIVAILIPIPVRQIDQVPILAARFQDLIKNWERNQ